MITLIDDTGYPVAVRTTGTHSVKECFQELKWWNDDSEPILGRRPYVEAINEDGVKVMENITEMPDSTVRGDDAQIIDAMVDRVATVGSFVNHNFYSTVTISNI